MNASFDQRYQQIDPDDPFILSTTGGTFGGPEDQEDSGSYAFGGRSNQGGQIDPEPYAAFPKVLYDRGIIKPGQRINVGNPRTGAQIMVIAKDIGPGGEGSRTRGIDLAPHVMSALGSDTDQPLVVDFTPDDNQSEGGGSLDDINLANPSVNLSSQAQEPFDTSSGGDGLSSVGIAPEEQQQAAPDEQPDIDYSHIETDPSKLSVVSTSDNGDTVFSDGSVLHSNGVVSIHADGQTIQAIPGMRKLHVIKASNPMIHWETDPDTRIAHPWKYDSEKGSMVRVPKEGELDQKDIQIPDGATGEEAIAKLSPQDQTSVRDFANYRKPGPTAGRSNPQFNRLEPYILAYKPDYRVTNFNALNKLTTDLFSQGPNSGGRAITSINTAIAHLHELDAAARKLDNEQLPDVNAVQNFFRTHSGDPRVKEYNRIKNLVDLELTRAFSGAAPDVASLRDAKEGLNASDNPLTQHNILTHDLPSLLVQRLGALTTGYKELTGEDFKNTTTPTADKIMTEWGFDDFPTMSGRAAGNATAPKQESTPVISPNQVQLWLDSPESQTPENADRRRKAIEALNAIK